MVTFANHPSHPRCSWGSLEEKMGEITCIIEGLAAVLVCALPYALDWVDEVLGWGMGE
jgi:hypothetical protein